MSEKPDTAQFEREILDVNNESFGTITVLCHGNVEVGGEIEIGLTLKDDKRISLSIPADEDILIQLKDLFADVAHVLKSSV